MMPVSGSTSVPLHIPARYMVVSVLSLLLWLVLSPWMLAEVVNAPLSYPVVAWTHLLTLGCIGSMILGASVQLVPVALQVPFPRVNIAGIFWYLWVAGIVLFEIGFAGEIRPLLVPGATLVGIVLTGYALAISSMVRSARHRDVVAFHLAAASWLAVIGFVLGWALALTNVNGVLGGKLLSIMAAHIICMVAGWVGLTLLGVGYKLIGMFTLAERAIDQLSGKISGVLIAGGTLAMVISITTGQPRVLVSIAAGLVAWGAIIAVLELARMYQKRMRKAIDVHMPFAITALVVLLAGAVSLVALTFEPVPMSNRLTITTVWLMLTGCFLVAIQGFFYKISTFLIWLHTYAPLAGKVAVPQLDAMYDRKLAFVGLGTWMASVIAIAMMLLGWLPTWWGWSIGLLAGGAIFALNVGRIARHWRGPVATPIRRI